MLCGAKSRNGTGFLEQFDRIKFLFCDQLVELVFECGCGGQAAMLVFFTATAGAGIISACFHNRQLKQ
jgi:hypothetical protein